MSYSQYTNPQWPQQGYSDPSNPLAQHHQQRQHQQPNGSYARQHGGQHTGYEQGGGGPVQQPQPQGYHEGYPSPQAGTGTYSGGGYGAQPQHQTYQPAAYGYNPSEYATAQHQQSQPQQQSPIASYDPRAYANTSASSYSQTFSPTAYPEPPSHGGSIGGPAPDPYAYSPSAHSSGGYSPHPSHLSQSPASAGHFSPQHHYSAHPPPPLPGRSSTHSSPHTGYGFQPSANNSSQAYTSRPHSQSTSSGISIPPSQTYGIPMPAFPEDTWAPSPPSHQGRRSPSSLHPANSFPSPMSSSTPGPTPPTHGFTQRPGTIDRHPQSRPLPGPPEPDLERESYFAISRNASQEQEPSQEELERLSQDELYTQVEDALSGRPQTGGRSPSISVSQAPFDGNSQTGALFSSSRAGSVQRNGSIVNGHLSPNPPTADHFTDDSDAEAAQGLAMMALADADDARRQSGGGQARFGGLGSTSGSQRNSHQRAATVAAGAGSDSDDFGMVDMSSFGGGLDVPMSYGGDPSQLASRDINGDGFSQTASSQHSSLRRSNPSQSSRNGYEYGMDPIHPFPPFNPAARVDASGTGGLAEPSGHGRRQSYDEGDEDVLTENQLLERFPDEPPDIFHYQALSSFTPGRPLPAPPGGELLPLRTDNYRGSPGQAPYPNAPDAWSGVNAAGQYVPRSASLVSHGTTPQVVQPLRSKTDAEERRLHQQKYRGSMYTTFESTPASSVVPDLPLLGAKRFVPAKLGAPDFKKCAEPWALSSILEWLLTVVSPEQYTELKEGEIMDALIALFTNKVPTMNIADAEGLSHRVVQNMYTAGTLATTEEWVKLVPGVMTGVIFQLTGVGCYSGTLHDHILPGRCYSRFCQRTLRKVNLQQSHSAKGPEGWMDKWKLSAGDIEGKDGKLIQRQHMLHETVYTEEVYMEQLGVLRSLYRDQLAHHEPWVISPNRHDKFVREVFGRLENVYKANEEHLLPQLKYRQEEQGPWIVGFSDIFRQWIRKAKSAYLEYAAGYPGADSMVRQEIERNIDFRLFLDRTIKNPQSLRLGWASFLKAPITRLQRYGLLLDTIYKSMKTDSDERRNLEIAIREVKAVTMECDTRVAEMQRKVDLADLGLKLELRAGMEKAVELNLDHFGRQLIHRGELQRMGSNRFNWVDTIVFLFDHYMVIAKPMTHGSEQGGPTSKFDVSRLPIPMDLLILESSNEPAVQKNAYVKGISTVTTVSGGRTSTPLDPATLGRVPTFQGPGPNSLQHVNTSASSNSLQTIQSNDGKESDKIMYPFRVKHLGRETYNLFASSENSRRDWVNKIIEAKTKHAAALYAQHAEPFRLRVMADSAFSYENFAGGRSGVVIKGTPVDRAIKEVEHRFKDTGRPGPICRARVNCATIFTAQMGGKTVVAVGTDYGVYLSDLDNPRGWSRAITQNRVTQITVLEDFNLFLLIADKVLIAYHLDVVCPTELNGPAPSNDSARKAPQKLSGSRDVGFFVSGRMKDRQLVFYKKRENLASVFKVLEPIYQKSTEKKSRNIFKRGNTEFFRDYDEFYIPAECTGMNLFHSSLAVSTARGFEVLTLDKKIAWTVPELKSPEVENIANHIKDQKALAMLRLTDSEFLLCYSNCAVYANKHGEVSRSVIMDFVGTAHSAALYGAYLVLFDSDFVEIRNANNGRLKQIIAGREIKCLDDGGSWSSAGAGSSSAGANGGALGHGSGQNSTHEGRTVKFVMQHPEMEKVQVVVELLLNENMKE